MFYRFRVAFVFTLLLSLVFAIPAFAGGWAVITLDELPAGVAAGEPLTVGFTVRQHGRTPMSGLEPTITAMSSPEDRFIVYAQPDGKPGHYTAALTFPKEGDWEWSIQAFTMDQPMPVLRVAAPGAAIQPVIKTDSSPAAVPWLMIVRASVFGAALAGLVIAIRRRSRAAAALAGLCLLAGIGTFMTGAAAAEAAAQGKLSAGGAVSSVSQAEQGEQLFVAKGCITCHINNKVERASEYWTIDVGAPNLTNFSASPEVLHVRLKDPAAAKSDTNMPNLHLSEAEIEALIAFINSK